MTKVSRRFVLCALTLAATATVARSVTAGEPVERTFRLRIEGDAVAGGFKVVRVEQGDHVRITWITDAPTVLHLHGYDIEVDVQPGVPADLIFDASIAGRFPINVHGHGTAGGHSESALVQIEVSPK